MTPQELKNSILQLAIQGKLVEQRPEEGTAQELYRQIQEEKRRLIKEGKIKREKPLPEIAEDEAPFEIPESWMWVYIGDIFLHNTGKAQNSSGSANGIIRKFITTSNLYWNYFDFSKVKEMPFTEQELKRCTVQKGDLLVCEGGDCGRSAIWTYDEEVCIQNHVHRLRPYKEISIEYFYYLFYLYKFTGKLRGRGVAIQGLSNEAIHKVICPFPPLAEQKRIVGKIEELLPYIDRYEQAWNRLEEFNQKFPIDMRKSLLRWAIQGRLVEQRREEGTAEALYRQIQEVKRRLIAEKKIKANKKIEPISDDIIPFDIPDSWMWARFGDLVHYSMGKTPPRAEAEWWGRDFPWVSIADMPEGGHICETKERVTSAAVVQKFGNKVSPAGTLLMSFKLTVGRVSFLDIDAVHNEAIISIYPFVDDGDVEKMYLFYVLPFISQFGESKNAIKGKTLNDTSIRNLLIPLPPLPEQKRIVARLEELLPLCERLK